MNLEDLNNTFITIEKKHFNIINNFIKGQITYDEVKEFENLFMQFKENLYQYVPQQEEIIPIAKMKSKLQHYNTEILEDEELLKQAYSNTNRYIEKL